MAKSATNETGIGFEDALWATADKLRGTVDAAEYKHGLLGFLFLKDISVVFHLRREDLKIELEGEIRPRIVEATIATNKRKAFKRSFCERCQQTIFIDTYKCDTSLTYEASDAYPHNFTA